jgi:cellulose synthase/poly-beta-1,6-N-acetylglucosamine synthase-like glycosyltransferase/peptidoglycan/xylan/chitin deacetylase (PgdA/CDA1 family)/spore germination protein YaaH
MVSPVFFDSTGRRRRLVGRLSFALLALIVFAALVFAATLVKVPTTAALAFGREREQAVPFLSRIAHIRHKLPRLARANTGALPLRIGFYVPWDEESATSLHQHFDELDWVVAADALINTGNNAIVIDPDVALHSQLSIALHRPVMMLMVQNVENDKFSGTNMAALLASPTRADALVRNIIAQAQQGRWNGVVFDVESLPAASVPAYLAMLARNHHRFQDAGLKLGVTAPAADSDWDLSRFAAATDTVFVMDYDQHWQGGESGPIAANNWFADRLANARAKVPANKLVIAIGSYGYDWHGGKADSLTIDEAWLAAHDSSATVQFDPDSGNSGFAYQEDGEKHTIWMMDAAASWNQLSQLRGVAGVALWRLGSEDPGFWEALAASRTNRLPNLTAIAPSKGADVTGSGEVLRISAEPSSGARQLTFSGQMITGESYARLPMPFEIDRSGARDPKAIALTFDDGPDPDFTPRILDVLEAKHAPAAFFVIGENALLHPQILRRIDNDGFDIGNHTYTHPNLAEVSPLGASLELNATQRLIEAYTGRATRLFRAPYFGDAEPTTADELEPAAIAQKLGYTIVGLHVDPGDWRRPGVQAIVDGTLAQVHGATPDRSTNIVLLHDGGGNREQTVAALPLIIDRLRSEGYRLVSLGDLVGASRDSLMPPVGSSDRVAVAADVGVFAILIGIGYTIKWLFFFAIALGIARAVVMTTLALLDRVSRAPVDDSSYRPTVSVIVPAFNEERVILSSLECVLASSYPALQVIVADDGSKDATSELVRAKYASDPRVTLLTMVNGGKASALNRALVHAHGEIVIALDADTQFMPDTISKLVRWFVDPLIGAVAGNARVGNRINLITRWQAIEYVTAQNVERRALDALRAITVVPGAVGAWRRTALDAVGGYPEDTLAEDQDLTIAIQRQGWRVAYDVEAVALTEAPETFAGLGKQRFRWSFGTLQCLWKHRAVLSSGNPRGLAWFGMPQAWLFQIMFAAISPMIDLALLLSIVGTTLRVQQHGWDQTQSDVLRMGLYWSAFVSIDLLAGWIAYRLEPSPQRFPALLLLAQRFIYRQLMYGVVIRSLVAALRGRMVGWGKLERTGKVGVESTD